MSSYKKKLQQTQLHYHKLKSKHRSKTKKASKVGFKTAHQCNAAASIRDDSSHVRITYQNLFQLRKINAKKKDVDAFVTTDFKLINYNPHQKIELKMAVKLRDLNLHFGLLLLSEIRQQQSCRLEAGLTGTKPPLNLQ